MHSCDRRGSLEGYIWISGIHLVTFSFSRASDRGLLGRDDTADGAGGAFVESDMIGALVGREQHH